MRLVLRNEIGMRYEMEFLFMEKGFMDRHSYSAHPVVLAQNLQRS